MVLLPISDGSSLSSIVRARLGSFETQAFCDESGAEHLALWVGEIDAISPLLRIQSHCLTSTAFGSCMCDCADQLTEALGIIQQEHAAILLYLDQEARGHGLVNKINVISHYNEGVSLKEAQNLAGVPEDKRDYRICADILRVLKVKMPVRLLCESDKKTNAVRTAGIDISECLSFPIRT